MTKSNTLWKRVGGIACLLWQYSTADDSQAEQNDGCIFTNANASASSINDYFGAYQLREIAKTRLWYDTHKQTSEDPIFTMDYWTAEVSYNYEMMDVSDLTAVDYTDTEGEGETESGCGSAVSGLTGLAIAVPAIAAVIYASRRRRSSK